MKAQDNKTISGAVLETQTSVRLAKIIGFTNRKGGVGKTASVRDIAWYMAAELHQKILVVDLDSQANLTTTLMTPLLAAQYLGLNSLMAASSSGVLNAGPTVLSIFEDLSKALANPGKLIYSIDGIDSPRGKLDLIPGSYDLGLMLQNHASEQENLDLFLQDLRMQYDYILLDFSPSDTSASFAGLRAVDAVVVPMELTTSSVSGLYVLNRTLRHKAIKRGKKNPIQILGVLQTGRRSTGGSKVLEKEANKQLEKACLTLQWPRYNSAMPHSSSIEAASSHVLKKDKQSYVRSVYEVPALRAGQRSKISDAAIEVWHSMEVFRGR